MDFINYITENALILVPVLVDLTNYAGLYGQAIEEIQVQVVKR